MKKITLSVASALLLTSSVFALETKIDNVKVEGAAGLYYNTDDSGADGSHFDQPNSAADAFVTLKVTADLNKKLKTGISATTMSTLGLENNLVSGTFSGTHPNVVDDYTVVSEAWLEATLGEKTTVTLGRQKLDTPLVFSETWSVMPNTYEATVVANKSIKNLTLIGAYVGRGNGASDDNTSTVGSNAGGPLSSGGEFGTFGNDANVTNNGGAYALGAVYSAGDLTVQAWAYNVENLVDAMWAEVEYAPETGFGIGLQHTSLSFKNAATAALADNDASAAKIAMTKKDTYKLALAYSATGKNTANGGAAFNVGGGAQSKLYTEAWWNYGYVTRSDTTAKNLTAEYTITKGLDAGLYVTQTKSSVTNVNQDMSEVTVSLAKEYDGFSATLVYIQTDAEDQNSVNGTATAYSTVQVYLDAEF